MTCSCQSHGHRHNGGLSRSIVITQVNQRRTQVAELTLIHARDIGELCQRGRRIRSHDIRRGTQINHCPGKICQIVRFNAQLTGNGNHLSDVIRRGSNLRGHLLNVS